VATKRRALSATEFLSQLAKDDEYQSRKAAADADRKENEDRLALAEGPIVADLVEVGVEVSSVWDLVNTTEPYPGALPVLISHLARGGYPDRVMEGLGRALAVQPAHVYWDELKRMYSAPRSVGEEVGVAVALAAAATSSATADLINFLRDADRGDSRLYLVRPLLRVGGERGRSFVESLQLDPDLGKEARLALQSHRP
jgi:hypothetical protein